MGDNTAIRLGFYFDQDICIGCKTCQIACKDVNDLPVGVLFRRVRTYEAGRFPAPRVYSMSATCNHCASPACVAACPTGAMRIADDGTVVHDDDPCVGCGACVKACPYGVPVRMPEMRTVGKCDACASLRARGENPACVDACPMRALEFGPLDELKRRHAQEDLTADLAVLPSSTITDPSLLVHPRTGALASDFRETAL